MNIQVFCTKRKPNCNACPLRADCRHYASAYARYEFYVINKITFLYIVVHKRYLEGLKILFYLTCQNIDFVGKKNTYL